MISKKIIGSCKNAIGTVFLLAGAFFVCSTLISIRAVFADPIAPVNVNELILQQGARSNVNARTGSNARTNPRAQATAARRATVARTAVPAGNATAVTNAQPARSATPRTLVLRPNARANASRANTGNATVTQPARNVVSRANTGASRVNATRSVRARTATTDMADNARISLQGSAIRGSKTSSINYLNTNRLYTGNYSNIIDSSTGLISADAFNNCMESYYTCMDEICTARNAAQRRCACAGRVKAFASAEDALEKANEELIKASGELALLIANKGKEVSDAFRLTDAEKVLNCVSWKEMSKEVQGKTKTEEDATKWCQAHGIYNTSDCSSSQSPAYCSTEGDGGNSFGFNIKDHDLDGSDILAQLQSWAAAKEEVTTIVLGDDEESLLGAFADMSGLVSNLSGTLETSKTDLKDSLAETWGYELFEYAHNNVCSRVLDSCFNGIYEACGTPPSGTKCVNGAARCPYNYNSKIDVDTESGEYKLNFVSPDSGYTAYNDAACFGYENTTDPYSNLRGPVADARRSIMQKYALDANADCDLYGEQLRTTAQNIQLQKVAAEQALQQKRLEFVTEERETMLADGQAALSNFHECLSEIYDCYTETADDEENWTDARIKTYCSQVANVPHCYDEMICRPLGTQFTAVIDLADNTKCDNTTDYETNTCRNVVTLNEILNGVAEPTNGGSYKNVKLTTAIVGDKTDSAMLREMCLRQAMGLEIDGTDSGTNTSIRHWKSDN
jgi:hypothetical protein